MVIESPNSYRPNGSVVCTFTPGRLASNCCGATPGTCAWMSATEMDAVVRVEPVPTTLTASSVRASCAIAGRLEAPSNSAMEAAAGRRVSVVRAAATEVARWSVFKRLRMQSTPGVV